MQRSAEEIVEWNLQKIDAGVCHLHSRLTKVFLRLKDSLYDALRANLIVNNIMISMDHMEEDINRLCNMLGIADDRFAPRETSKKEICNTRGSESDNNLTNNDKKEDEQPCDQTYNVVGQTLDITSFNNAVKQVKALERMVLSGNIFQRIEKLENDQTSKNLQQRLETMEEDVHSKIEKLKAETEMEMGGKIVCLETLVHRIVKGLFDGESGIDEHSVCILRKLTDLTNVLNEDKAEIQNLTKKVEHLESMQLGGSFRDRDRMPRYRFENISRTWDDVRYSSSIYPYPDCGYRYDYKRPFQDQILNHKFDLLKALEPLKPLFEKKKSSGNDSDDVTTSIIGSARSSSPLENFKSMFSSYTGSPRLKSEPLEPTILKKESDKKPLVSDAGTEKSDRTRWSNLWLDKPSLQHPEEKKDKKPGGTDINRWSSLCINNHHHEPNEITETGSEADDIEFSVKVHHYGPWNTGTTIKITSYVEYNTGNAFDEDKCWFVPPVDGIYKFYVRMKRYENGCTNLEAWTCNVAKGGWVKCLFVVAFLFKERNKCYVGEHHLEAGVAVRLRVSGGTEFDDCVFKGRLIMEDIFEQSQ